MKISLKLVSLNIERYKHLDLVEKFLAARMPDIFCVQEVFEQDLERFSRVLGGASHTFEPMGKRPDEPPPGVMGIAIFSRLPIKTKRVHYYAGTPGALRDSIQSDESTYNLLNKMVLVCDIEKEGTAFRIATTHFTWTPDGKADKVQRTDIKNLLEILSGLDEFVLTGDFNAPRGGEIFGMLAEKYRDNIPPEYKTSLNVSLHRAGKSWPEELADKMVDGMFSTPAYVVSDVELVSGVSDHCAIVATVSPARD